MSKLTTFKFCKLYEMSSGISSTPEQAGHGSPFLSFSTVYNHYFIPEKLDDRMDTSEEEQEKYSVLKGDIFLTRTSEVVDELAMSAVALKDYPCATFSGFLKRLRPLQDDVTYHKYMAFYLRSKLFRKTMTNNAVLTLRASLNENIFSYLDLILPDYKEQVKIGELLHLLNRKIDLNKRINAELEAMAKTLYDYWFVQFDFPFDFAQGKPNKNGKPYKSSGGKMVWNKELKREIPDGWTSSELGQDCDLYQPKTISEKDMSDDGDYLVYGANGVVGRYSSYNHESSVIAITCRGNSCGAINVTRPYSWITGNAMVVKPKINCCIDYLFNALQRANVSTVITGSAQPQITRSNLAPLKIVSPATSVLEQYNVSTESGLKQRMNNLAETEHLSSLRDWLLPMLMNGQVKVG